MKKIFFSIILIVIIILAIVLVGISDNNKKVATTLEFNSQFEKFNGQTIYGADVLTIINKAIDNNENNGVQKDDNGFYIEDDNSVKVELTLLSTGEDGEIVEVTYQMETLQKAGLTEFIANFGLTSFECTNIEYNSQNRVSKVYLKQLEI